MDVLPTKYLNEFLNSTATLFIDSDKRNAGYVRSAGKGAGNVAYMAVYEAGHMVSQPSDGGSQFLAYHPFFARFPKISLLPLLTCFRGGWPISRWLMENNLTAYKNDGMKQGRKTFSVTSLLSWRRGVKL